MKTIHKFPLPSDPGVFMIKMPAGAIVLDAQMQGDNPMLWVQVDKDCPPVNRRFFLYGTDWPIDDAYRYITTLQVGKFVWHLFEEA